MTDESSPQDIGGGHGSTAAMGRPDLVLAAPAGIVALTPASTVVSAGETLTLVTQSDLQVLAGRHHAVAVQDGIVWFTQGQAGDAKRPVQDIGIRAHAASGSVHVEASAGKAAFAADRRVDVTSTQDAITVQAPEKVSLFAGGSSLVIGKGGITLTTPGRAVFRAAIKNLTGPGSASVSGSTSAGVMQGCVQSMQAAAQAQAGVVTLD